MLTGAVTSADVTVTPDRSLDTGLVTGGGAAAADSAVRGSTISGVRISPAVTAPAAMRPATSSCCTGDNCTGWFVFRGCAGVGHS